MMLQGPLYLSNRLLMPDLGRGHLNPHGCRIAGRLRRRAGPPHAFSAFAAIFRRNLALGQQRLQLSQILLEVVMTDPALPAHRNHRVRQLVAADCATQRLNGQQSRRQIGRLHRLLDGGTA